MTELEKRERYFAELRWEFAKTWIEPNIAVASNDPSALFLLPNHEALIRAFEPAVCIVKCRKTAHSWGIALKALCRAATEPRSTTIIGSYDEDEAKEKLNFLDWQYGCLPKGLRAQLGMTDGMEIRRFPGTGARIKFISRKAPTGAGASIEWDEFSVEKPGRVTAEEILAAALGCTTHTGQVSIGGTQRGPNTIFNQIVMGPRDNIFSDNPLFDLIPQQPWKVYKFPWWKSPALCKNVFEAVRLAPGMPTEDRVVAFGNEKLLKQFGLYLGTKGQGLEIFQREFEMLVLDDRESYFDLPLIAHCAPGDLDRYWFEFTNIDGAPYGGRTDVLAPAKKLIDALAEAIRFRRLPPGEWGWSMDVGRDHDVDEIWIGQTLATNKELLCPRLNIGMSLMPFDGKEEIIHYMMRALPMLVRGQIDATKGGHGRALQDKMFRRYGFKASPFEFTNASKQIIVTSLKARMESNRIKLPRKTTNGATNFSKLETQLLQFKKYISDAGNVMFDVERNKGHHGDCALSLCMLAELFSMPVRHSARRGATAVRAGVGNPLPQPDRAFPRANPAALARQSHAPTALARTDFERRLGRDPLTLLISRI